MDNQLSLFKEINETGAYSSSPQDSNRRFCSELEEELNSLGFNESEDKSPSPMHYLKRAEYTDMYGGTRHSTFLIHHKLKGLLRVEAHRQVQSGSVDQKFPFFYESLSNATEENVIIVFDGKGYKKEAFDWLMYQTSQNRKKSFNVFPSKELFLDFLLNE